MSDGHVVFYLAVPVSLWSFDGQWADYWSIPYTKGGLLFYSFFSLLFPTENYLRFVAVDPLFFPGPWNGQTAAACLCIFFISKMEIIIKVL